MNSLAEIISSLPFGNARTSLTVIRGIFLVELSDS